jgi:hypothetical protein
MDCGTQFSGLGFIMYADSPSIVRPEDDRTDNSCSAEAPRPLSSDRRQGWLEPSSRRRPLPLGDENGLPPTVIAVVVIIFAVLFFLNVRNEYRLIQRGVLTKARISAEITKGDVDVPPQWMLKLNFKTHDGESIAVTCSRVSRAGPNELVGTEIEIIYDPERPYIAAPYGPIRHFLRGLRSNKEINWPVDRLLGGFGAIAAVVLGNWLDWSFTASMFLAAMVFLVLALTMMHSGGRR